MDRNGSISRTTPSRGHRRPGTGLGTGNLAALIRSLVEGQAHGGHSLEIVGAVQVKRWASSDRKDTDFTVKLTDDYPDGRSMIFLDGIVKARYRNSYLKEEFLEPGQVYEFEIDLGYIAIAIAPGHRLRLAISSSNFDRWDINPNTGQPYGEHAVSQSLLADRLRADPPRQQPEYTETLVATNTIFMDAQHPTHVILPLTSGSAGQTASR